MIVQSDTSQELVGPICVEFGTLTTIDTPIFIHSSSRTSSTWLWAALRTSSNAIVYCEIFHEIMESIDCNKIASVTPASWRSNHPSSAPYFLEFLPLVEPEGGIREYSRSMAAERFIPADGLNGSISLEERAYVSRLLRQAQTWKKTAVLTDTRTLGRMRALKKEFGGYHVLFYRNLFHQWASYSSQMLQGNSYFIN